MEPLFPTWGNTTFQKTRVLFQMCSLKHIKPKAARGRVNSWKIE